MDPNQPLEELRRLVKRTFEPSNLADLSMDLHLDHNDFQREDHGETVRNIISYFIRDGRIAFFIKECVERYPNPNFKRLLNIAERTPEAFELTSIEHNKTDSNTLILKALLAQSIKLDQLTHPHEHESQQNIFDKPHSNAPQPQFNEGDRNIELWNKPDGRTPAKIRPQIVEGSKFDKKEINNSPIIDRLQHDIARLETNLETMEKMEGLLEEVREKIGYLLEGLREEKFEIKRKEKVQRQLLEEEMMKAAGKLTNFQENYKSNFMTSKPAKTSQSGDSMPNFGNRSKSPAYKLGF